MDISIIIVSWNVCDLLEKNLKAIYKSSIKSSNKFNFEIFVVDNNSKDRTLKMLTEKFPDINIISNSHNLGFAKANNQAIKLSKGRYVLLLNPDMRVYSETLEKMIKWMDRHQDVGISTCQLVNENGKTINIVRKFPSIIDQALIILKIPHIFPNVLNKYLMKNFDYSKPTAVDSIRGSFFMIRRKVIEQIGLLDERYFIWFEEVDYCKKAKQANWKIMYTPITKCVDYVGKSFSKVADFKKQKIFTKSMLKYFKKWKPSWQYYVLLVLRQIDLSILWIISKR